MTIDFTDKAQYDTFVNDVANAVLANFQFTDELERDIADELIEHHYTALVKGLLEKLIEHIEKKRGVKIVDNL